MRTEIRLTSRDAGFQHDALFYSGTDGFVTRTSAFIRDSVAEGEPILVVVSEEKIELLRRELGGDPDGVRFADMQLIGRNPARIIPAWRDFVAEHATSGRRFRGIGEPIWATRSASELVECARHEALLNLAFAEGQTWWLACPYDTGSLPEAVLAEAERNHPWVMHGGERFGSLRIGASMTWRGPSTIPSRSRTAASESIGSPGRVSRRFASMSPKRRPGTASTRPAPGTWC